MQEFDDNKYTDGQLEIYKEEVLRREERIRQIEEELASEEMKALEERYKLNDPPTVVFKDLYIHDLVPPEVLWAKEDNIEDDEEA